VEGNSFATFAYEVALIAGFDNPAANGRITVSYNDVQTQCRSLQPAKEGRKHGLVDDIQPRWINPHQEK